MGVIAQKRCRVLWPSRQAAEAVMCAGFQRYLCCASAISALIAGTRSCRARCGLTALRIRAFVFLGMPETASIRKTPSLSVALSA